MAYMDLLNKERNSEYLTRSLSYFDIDLPLLKNPVDDNAHLIQSTKMVAVTSTNTLDYYFIRALCKAIKPTLTKQFALSVAS